MPSSSNLMPSLETFAKGAFATAAGISTIGVGLLYYGQNFLIYPSAYPPGSRTEVPSPTDFGLQHEDVNLQAPDGVKIHCFLLMQRKELTNSQATHVDYTDDETDAEFASTRPTIVMFHGNGGNVGHRIPLAKVFYVKMRCNVLMVSYRGYGYSEGSPSEKGLQMDAQTALDFLTSHEHLSKSPIVLYGQSIGGAVSIHLASQNPNTIRALILENTFLSLPRLIPHALPFLSPFTFLCHQKWDSASKLPLIPQTTPILMLSGVRDEVVPREQMQGLWKIRTGDGKTGNGKSRFVEFEFGAHNDTCIQHGYWTTIAEFIASLGQS
ncbi:hypothetical protein JAAARDRAFT_37523 [Jaapia argillacea MUCL 33604]|uniref:AB hydrolase-1 domain-containing protein n=1 Tax=Jaapia argillacea MUCL 33604 TaxID=933084 RepID=A0A067PL39_9AGAM|nr:hypothetical protein JAAARDRAFT_37523 [Jaapia argillacea MUCL 33604]